MSSSPGPARTLGLAALARAAQDAGPLSALVEALIDRLTADFGDSGARLDLSTLLQLTNNPEQGLPMQAEALAKQSVYRRIHGDGGGLRVLAFMVAGDMMANTPLDFLLEGSNVELTTVYLDGPPPAPETLPDHDVAFLAIGESEANDPLLARLTGAFDAWPRPVVNAHPERIAALTRDGVAARFKDHPLVIAPETRRLPAGRLQAAAVSGSLDGWEGPPFPVIIRPVGSHAGRGLAKLDDLAALAAYLARFTAAEYFVSAFKDYSGPDGLFRKLRIVFIDGRPFISHLAVSERWMVHYLNADMETRAENRAEEAAMMARFDNEFAVRNRAALEALSSGLQLDYFGVDCAELGDGRILLFEADVAMIVHAMDSETLYPYKKPAMRTLFEGFLGALSVRAGVSAPRA